MISLNSYLGHKDLLIILGMYATVLLIGVFVTYRYFNKKESNYKYFTIGIVVIYFLLGWVNANYYLKDNIDRAFLVLSILYIVALYLTVLSYKYFNDIESYKKSSYFVFVVIALFAVSGFSMAIDVDRYVGKDTIKETTAIKDSEKQDVVVTEGDPTNKIKYNKDHPDYKETEDNTTQEKSTEQLDLCSTEDSVYIKDCYNTEEEYLIGAYKDDAILNRYNTLNKSIHFAQATKKDSDMKVKFLTEFSKELKIKEPDNALHQIVEELKTIAESEGTDADSKITSYSELHTLLVQQLEVDSIKTPEIKDKLNDLGELKSTTTLFEYVNSVLAMESDDVMTQEMKKWVYDYIDKNEVK